MELVTLDTTSGAASPSYEQTPYREPRLGSGVRCPALLEAGQPGVYQDGVRMDAVRCESPLTTRMRAGVDTLDRPIGEYLCQTCGSVFVALVVSLDSRIRFADVVVDTDYDMSERQPISVGTALRRNERTQEVPVNYGETRARIEVCDDCGNLVRTDNGEWEAHRLTHRED